MELGGHILIEQPRSALRRFIKEMSLIEAFAMGLSGIVAALVWVCFQYLQIEGVIYLASAIALAGPVLEKLFFCVPGILTATLAWYRNHQTSSTTWWRSVLNEWKEQELWRVYRADLIWHDSTYSLVMLIVTYSLPPEWQGAWLLGTISAVVFFLALAFACWAEVKWGYLSFWLFLERLLSAGGTKQHYGQVRYVIARAPDGVEGFLAKMTGKFSLRTQGGPDNKQDFALEGARFPEFNEWRSIVQIRANQEGGAKLHLVWYRTRWLPGLRDLSDICIVSETIKLAWDLREPSLEEARRALGWAARYLEKVSLKALFRYERRYAANPDNISFAFDSLIEPSSGAIGVVELKFWMTPQALKLVPEANRRTLLYLSGLTTTQPRFVAPEMLEALPEF